MRLQYLTRHRQLSCPYTTVLVDWAPHTKLLTVVSCGGGRREIFHVVQNLYSDEERYTIGIDLYACVNMIMNHFEGIIFTR